MRMHAVAGCMEPSRCRCSSDLGRASIFGESAGVVIPRESMRQSGAAGVVPGGEPEGAYIRRCIGELADQNGSCFVVKAVVIFVGIRIFSAKSITVGEKNGFEPAMGAEAGVKGVVGWVADKGCVVGAHGEKRRVAVNQRAAETLINAGLAAQMAIGIIGGVERVVRLSHIVR